MCVFVCVCVRMRVTVCGQIIGCVCHQDFTRREGTNSDYKVVSIFNKAFTR